MTNSVLKNKFYILLAVAVLLAGFLRFYNITEVPVSLYWDEVSIGYNAYSIAETGRDEYGEGLPLLFRAFEDYKTPGHIYLTAVPVKLFGLSEFSVRFPSALLGTLTVLLTYFLVLELVRKKELFGFDARYIALITSLVLAVSPWHLQFSRASFEANTGLFFVVFGAFLFFRYLNVKKHFLLFSSVVLFAISIYFYRSMWVFVPLFLTFLFLINYKFLFKKENLKYTLISILIFVLMILPFVPSMASNEGADRGTSVSIINNVNDELNDAWAKKIESGPIGNIIYHRWSVYLTEIGQGYFSHFTPEFLFTNGDPNPRHGVGSVGVLYIWGVLFLIPGLFALFKLDRKITLAIFAWLILAPIPAALSYPTPHALRSINMIPIIQFTLVLGAFWLFSYIPNRSRMIVSALFVGLCLYFIINYFSVYHDSYAVKSSYEWADGHKQLAEYVLENEGKYEKILITGHWWQPHTFILFYSKYDPSLYQDSGDKFGFDKYMFSGTSWDMEGEEFGAVDLRERAGTRNFLAALFVEEFDMQKDNVRKIGEIRNKNGNLVFILVESK